MQIAFFIFAVACLATGALLAFTIRKIAFGDGDLPVTAEWIDQLSMDRYRPMLRLLDGQDLEFLRSQPGFNPKMEGQLRRQRRQMFEGYLRSLSMDFRRVCAAIRLIMICSNQDRPDLAGALIQQQIMFGLAFIQVRIALQFYSWGLCQVNVRDLMRAFDLTRIELRSLVPSTSAGA